MDVASRQRKNKKLSQARDNFPMQKMDSQNLNSPQIAIIGGGAAGYFAAITAAENNPGASVTLLEGTQRTLTKVKISGGGRCNVTHNCFDAETLVGNYPRGYRELRGPFSRFQPRDTVAWFAARGVTLKAEADGRMFPVSNSSSTIIECLQNAALAAGVKTELGSVIKEVTRVYSADGGIRFHLALSNGTSRTADKILLATGSAPIGHRIAAMLGHSIIDTVPSLFTFKIADSRLADIPGISFQSARVRLNFSESPTLEQIGPVLITHWGLSGPAVLKLSAWGARALHDSQYNAEAQINWMPSKKTETVLGDLLQYKAANPSRLVLSSPAVDLPKRFWASLVTFCEIASGTEWAHVTNKSLQKLANEITDGRYQVDGKGEFKEEFVTCGGVALKEVDFKTMQSRLCPNLYFAGEILDIDGLTGGFNFQNAWTTAWIAGQHMVQP